MQVSQISEINEKKRAYIEEFSIVFEGFGVPRMAGRVLAALLTAEPAEQTAEELAEQLQASRGGISGAVQLLEQFQLIERTRKPGDRRDYFRNKPNAIYEAMKKQMMMTTRLSALIDSGFDLIDSGDEVSKGLKDMKAYVDFIKVELPQMFERFEASLEQKETA